MKSSPYMLNKENFEYAKKKAKELGRIYKDCDLAAYLHMTKNNFSLIRNNHRPCQEIYLRQLGELWDVNWKFLAGRESLYLKEQADYEEELNEYHKDFCDFIELLSARLLSWEYNIKFTGKDPLDGCEISFIDDDGNNRYLSLSKRQEINIIEYMSRSVHSLLDNSFRVLADYIEMEELAKNN